MDILSFLFIFRCNVPRDIRLFFSFWYLMYQAGIFWRKVVKCDLNTIIAIPLSYKPFDSKGFRHIQEDLPFYKEPKII